MSAAASGSITPEAALALTMFLLFMASMLGMFGALRSQVTVYYSSVRACRDLAEAAYVLAGDRYTSAAEGSLTGSLVNYGLTSAAVSMEVRSDLGDEVDSLSGLTFAGSRFNGETQDVEVRASYRIPVFGMDRVLHIDAGQTIVCRAWTGKNADHAGGSGEPGVSDSRTVYIAESGRVYRLDENCTYLRVDIKQASPQVIGELRSNDGSKYYPCERCGDICGATVYYTAYGTRYHSDTGCPKLERHYHESDASDIQLPPCSKCGRQAGS